MFADCENDVQLHKTMKLVGHVVLSNVGLIKTDQVNM